jgi:dihydrofolate reductase
MTTTQQRRLRQSCLVSVNGVFTEPLAWAGPYFGPGSAASSLAALEDSGALLMGRRTYEIFSRQWPAASGDYAAYLNEMPKYVFSSSLQSPSWTNTAVISGDVVAAVTELKRAAGKDLIVYGHGRLGQTLCDAGLVDQLTLTIAPVFVASGSPLFQPGGVPRAWQLVSAGPGADPGLASLTYQLHHEATAEAPRGADR